MSLQLSVAVRNARLNAIEATIGASAILQILTGSVPANCAASSSGTVLATLNLPSTWLTSASGGTTSKSGTWQDLLADATGTAGYFRIFDSTGTVCGVQGTCTATNGGGDMTLDNTSIAVSQVVTVTSFSLTDGNL